MPHTPGPWICETVLDDEVFHISAASRSGRVPIAVVEFGFIGPIESEQQANASLITAAPMMLAALEKLMGRYDNYLATDRNQQDAYYALAKPAYQDWVEARAVIKAAKGE